MINHNDELKQQNISLKCKFTDSVTKQHTKTHKMNKILLANGNIQTFDNIANAATHPEPRIDINRVPESFFYDL
eukprot:1924840-Rhodomonas_salina.1